MVKFDLLDFLDVMENTQNCRICVCTIDCLSCLSLMCILYHDSQGVLDGKYDDLPEQSFYMVGGIEEVIAKAEKIAKESAA